MQCQTNFLCVTFILIFDHAENLIECFSHEMKFVHVDYIWLFVFFVECWPELRRFKKEKRWMRDDHLHLYVFFCLLYLWSLSCGMISFDLIWSVSLDRVRQLLHDQYLKIFTSGVLEGQFCWECTCSSQSIWCNCDFLWRRNSYALFKVIQLAEVRSRVDKKGGNFLYFILYKIVHRH